MLNIFCFIFCLQGLKDQRVEIKGYAEFVLQLEKVKSKVPDLNKKVEHIKNLFEVRESFIREAW